jgi:hypothetical protein
MDGGLIKFYDVFKLYEKGYIWCPVHNIVKKATVTCCPMPGAMGQCATCYVFYRDLKDYYRVI